MRRFIKPSDDRALNLNHICSVNYSRLEKDLRVIVIMTNGREWTCDGLDAIEITYQLCPAALEGLRLRWPRHKWAFHNLVAHPLLQLCAFCGQHKLGFWIHDATVPMPGDQGR